MFFFWTIKLKKEIIENKKCQATDDIGIRSTKFNSNCSFFCAHFKRNLCSWFIWQAETRDFVLTIIAITPNCLFHYQERLFLLIFFILICACVRSTCRMYVISFGLRFLFLDFQQLHWQPSIWVTLNRRPQMAAIPTAALNGTAKYVQQMTKAKPNFFQANALWNRKIVWINQVN